MKIAEMFCTIANTLSLFDVVITKTEFSSVIKICAPYGIVEPVASQGNRDLFH